MYLPIEAERILRDNPHLCFDDEFTVSKDDSNWFEENLGVKDASSSFISFYKIVAFPPVGNGAELLPLETIMEMAEEDAEELPQGIGSRFLRLTSFEGESAYYYDVESDKVYSVHFGEELDMINGSLSAFTGSFFDFLQGYYAQT
ncbi:hypothetical protein R50073_35600 [Maricurvus nonylphenolicus]|uniref:hypothetical protein n=1 Tax=Maricurvus nonylphenolicus TaxID=1008307 RepID=UPI0036F3A762